MSISSIEIIIEEARKGNAFLLVDNEKRENEWDIVFPAEFCTPEKINFMAKNGRGLICISVTEKRAGELWLVPMCQENKDPFHTAFTISVDAKWTSTWISAFDRDMTVKAIVANNSEKADLISPWHMFPLVAKNGGVLERPGHTEASIEICRLAGLYPSWVICEVLNDDGTMARLQDLIVFAQKFWLKIGSIDDLIQYKKNKNL